MDWFIKLIFLFMIISFIIKRKGIHIKAQNPVLRFYK